jgi:hypothetical protein
METSQKTGPGWRHTGHAIGGTVGIGGIRRSGAQLTGGQIMTTIHELLAGALVNDSSRYQVLVLTVGRARAVCGCGWAGHRRLTASGARLDAWLHAADTGHMPATPLTLTARAR